MDVSKDRAKSEEESAEYVSELESRLASLAWAETVERAVEAGRYISVWQTHKGKVGLGVAGEDPESAATLAEAVAACRALDPYRSPKP